MRERELKLAAPDGFRLPDFGRVDGVEAVAGEAQQFRTTYWDSEDLRLARWGCSLRHRGGEGWTVKLPGELAGDLLVRTEIPFPGPASRPPRAALQLLTAFLRGTPVHPMAKLRTSRQPVELRLPGGAAATVTLDDVTILDGSGTAGRFREVEVELRDGAGDEVLDAVRGRLAASGAGAADPTPKHVRALGERAQEPPEVEVPEPGPGSSTADVIRWTLASSVRRLILHDPLVRLGEDPEAVHQCRVATRRLRSDLASFGAHLDAGWAESVRGELKWLAGALGALRDAEVLLDLLSRSAGGLLEADREAVASPLELLAQRRDRARAQLEELVRQKRYVALLDAAVRTALDPGPGAGAPVQEALRVILEASWGRLERAVDRLEDPPSDEALHTVRIRAKRCRYAAEAAAPVLGKPAARLAKRAEAIQEVLGEHQDAVVAEAWLREASRDAPGPVAFAAGRLAATIAGRRDQARRRFPDKWRRAVRAAEKVAR